MVAQMGEVKFSLKERMLYLLALLNFAGGIDGKTKLQKIMFLAKKENKVNHGYNFIKYLHGPFSQELSEDLRFLEQADLIKVESTAFGIDEKGFPIVKSEFQLSEKGEEVIKKNIKKLNNLKGLKKAAKLNKKNLNNILNYVYKKYM